jgi:hypothetical protein
LAAALKAACNLRVIGPGSPIPMEILSISRTGVTSLKQRRSDLGWGMIKRIRSTLPRRSEQQVKRDVDAAIQQVRREHSRTARA